MRRPPKYLGKAGKAFWLKTEAEYNFETEHEYKSLADACVCRDTIAKCRLLIADDGPVISDRFGQPKKHPALKAMHDSQRLFLSICRELQLSVADDEALRPPRLY